MATLFQNQQAFGGRQERLFVRGNAPSPEAALVPLGMQPSMSLSNLQFPRASGGSVGVVQTSSLAGLTARPPQATARQPIQAVSPTPPQAVVGILGDLAAARGDLSRLVPIPAANRLQRTSTTFLQGGLGALTGDHTRGPRVQNDRLALGGDVTGSSAARGVLFDRQAPIEQFDSSLPLHASAGTVPVPRLPEIRSNTSAQELQPVGVVSGLVASMGGLWGGGFAAAGQFQPDCTWGPWSEVSRERIARFIVGYRKDFVRGTGLSVIFRRVWELFHVIEAAQCLDANGAEVKAAAYIYEELKFKEEYSHRSDDYATWLAEKQEFEKSEKWIRECQEIEEKWMKENHPEFQLDEAFYEEVVYKKCGKTASQKLREVESRIDQKTGQEIQRAIGEAQKK